MPTEELKELQQKANLVRQDIITMLGEAGSGHPGGSLSSVEIMVALFYEIMEDYGQDSGDKFVLSKGHAAPALYAILADKGFFEREQLTTLRKIGSILQGHPDMKKTPGVQFSTGSLGQGLSAANGMAIASKYRGIEREIYVLLGDGELQEGQIWEAVMTAHHRRLDNLTAFVDYNKLQIDGSCKQVKSLEKIEEKFAAFGWQVYTVDGHNLEEIIKTTQKKAEIEGRPSVIVCKTIKGKGVSFMEDEVGWHGQAPDSEQVKTALTELRRN